MRRSGMVRWDILGLALSLVGVAGLQAAGKSGETKSSPAKALSARLQDPAGKPRMLSEFKDKKTLVVVFLGTECPISNSYAEALSKLDARYRDQGVQFVGVNALTGEDVDRVGRHAKEYRISFPVLKDADQALANALGARVTPEAFVLDAGRVVRYQGRIDDSYASRTKKRSQAASRDLEAALDAVIAGKPVAVRLTEALGCPITRTQSAASSTAKVTYHRDVAPILQERCQSCHRPGQVAPFSLLSYKDAKSWASEIKTFTQTHQMPPWKAEPGHGDFVDVRRMPDAEIATLAAWADSGAPEGDRKHAPAPKQWADDWMLGKPDLVLKTSEAFNVEATGKDVFRCFVLPTNLTEDKNVVAVEVRPGNARVVHHVINFIDTSGKGRQLDQNDPAPGYSTGPGGIGILPAGALGGWAPGNFPRFLPAGVGMPLPKGSDVVIQVHYHKTGKPETDQTSIGLYFAKEPVQKRLRTWPLTTLAIKIPPDVARHEIKVRHTVPFDVTALTITPHMHLLGKEMKVTATLPDGTVKNMVWIKDWDYRWQDTYRFKEPVALPKGTHLDLVAYYDNTKNNPLNPHNPPKQVGFGEETTDEMAFAFIEYVLDKEVPGKLGLFGLFGRR